MTRKLLKITPIALVSALALALSVTSPARAGGDPANGKKVFRKCQACHSLEAGKNRVGPSLFGIVGRDAAAVEGFKYSSAMSESGIVWTEPVLDEYLANPRSYVKGSRMAFPGLPDAQDRADLISYLKTTLE